MITSRTFARTVILTFALLGLAGGALAVTHGPSLTVADSSSGTVDVG